MVNPSVKDESEFGDVINIVPRRVNHNICWHLPNRKRENRERGK